jgi:uncharacterized protein (TIGR03382 family)
MRPSNLRKLAPHLLWLALGGCVEQDSALPTADEAQEIVGGTTAEITAAPWQVSLQTQNQHFCGGSIISPTWVATASHCVAEGAPERIVAGVSRTSLSAQGQIRQVKRVIMYPGYTDPTVGKDAALIELTTPLTLNTTTVKAIRPVTAADPATLTNPGINATITGWGATTEGGQTLPDQLRTVTVPILSLADASANYGQTLTPDQLPAGLAAGGRDSCQGDSGGPMVVAGGNGEMLLAGIVSWGDGCARAGKPGLYARLSSFSGWMDGYVGGPPQAVAGSDMTVAPGALVSLDASASVDAGFGVIASYSWTQVSGPSVTIDGASAKLATFSAPSGTGDIEIELKVTDGGGATATDRVLVTLSKNGSGDGTDNGSGNDQGGDDGAADEITGGCSTGGSGSGLGFGVLLALGALVQRRRR